MTNNHKDAIAQSKALGEVSDENLVDYFAPELLLIGESRRATALLPDSVIKNFVRIGFLEYLRGPKGHTLTEKAKDVLQKIRE